MVQNYYSQELHGPFDIFEIPNFVTQSGAQLESVKLAYSTAGTLAADRSNVILFPSWYSGTSKILEQAYLGPDRALDPNKYFIIFVNQIGNGLSSSPSNFAAPHDGAGFPKISIADDVILQRRFLEEKFKITRLALVIGGSMGAQQAYEWAVRFPGDVERLAPIAGLAATTEHNKLLVQTFIDAIAIDPAFSDGDYADAAQVRRGLINHSHIFAASAFTPDLFNQKLWQVLGYTDATDFIKNFIEKHFVNQDPNNLILLLSKWRDADVSEKKDLAPALSKIKAKTFVIAINEDGFFPKKDIETEQQLIPKSELRTVSSKWGHLALFGFDTEFNRTVDTHLSQLLSDL